MATVGNAVAFFFQRNRLRHTVCLRPPLEQKDPPATQGRGAANCPALRNSRTAGAPGGVASTHQHLAVVYPSRTAVMDDLGSVVFAVIRPVLKPVGSSTMGNALF